MIDVLLIGLLVVASMLTAVSARLMRAVIGLAVTSALLTAVMFRLQSPIAAVFELSVCAGLIPAIFIAAIGMTQRLTPEALAERRKETLRRFWFLPLLIMLAGIALSQARIPAGLPTPATPAPPDVREVLWIMRHTDLLGQIVVLLGGALGVAVLVKEPDHE
jgi:NADH-quinone oxidoreductase subunit J